MDYNRIFSYELPTKIDMTATVAMCDPELTLALPPHFTASTGMDALAHALESYVNKTTQPISEALSIRRLRWKVLRSGGVRT